MRLHIHCKIINMKMFSNASLKVLCSPVSFHRDVCDFFNYFAICTLHRDIVIQQLRQQIDDLTLICEEERLNHKMNLRKVK